MSKNIRIVGIITLKPSKYTKIFQYSSQINDRITFVQLLARFALCSIDPNRETKRATPQQRADGMRYYCSVFAQFCGEK